MTDASQAIEAEAFAALSTHGPLTALSPVYQHVPENTPPPVVIVGDIDEDGEEIAGKDDDDTKASLLVITEFRGKARKALLTMMGHVKTALNGHKATRDGWELSFNFRDSNGVLQEDGVTYVGNSRFTVWALRP